ncbi:MAG: hypothetical protein ACYCZW_03850 [Minisyncoccota bacterium]
MCEVTTETKICAACKQELPVTQFYFRSDKGVYRSSCKKCKRIKTKEEVIKQSVSETKVCKHCGIEKSRDDFQKAGGGKWLQPYCKPCDKIRKQKHREQNIEHSILKGKLYYQQNRDTILLKDKEARLEKRPETLKRIRASIDSRKMSPEEKKKRKSECDKRYKENNVEKVKAMKRKYYDMKGNQMAKEWQRKQMGDIGFVTKKRLRGRIYVALKRGIKSESTMKLLGCSIEFFKEYFESKFTEGMNWDVYMEGGIHIDHIVPCKHFNLSDPEEQKKCFHWENLQPLWQLDNLKKGASLQYKIA